MQNANRFPRGFSLTELLAVMGIMAILAGLTVPAITHIGGAERLNGSARTVSNLLTVARSEAIANQTTLRFGVLSESSNPEAKYRRCGIWRYDSATGQWILATKLEEMATGVAFAPDFGANAGKSNAGNLFAENPANAFTSTVNGQPVEVKFMELMPNGSINVPGMSDLVVWLALAESHGGEIQGSLLNWAKIDASVLTGRLKIVRP